jgi:hypothetical protein
MPNTLAHFGIQSLFSKALFSRADIKWIGLGCLIPDLPWVGQRFVYWLNIVNPVDLRLYVIILSSFFMTLILAAAISLQVQSSRKIFFLLSCNCLLHLLLDATQIKWANGVHLLAPFSWKLVNFGSYWPEQLPALLLTLAGLTLYPLLAWKDRNRKITILNSGKRQLTGSFLLCVYLVLPCLMLNGPLQENNHFTAVLTANQRAGLPMEIDRKNYHADSHTIEIFTGEQLTLQGKNLPGQDATLSILGKFVAHDTILISKYHVHTPLRDVASMIGISMLIASWLVALFNKRIRIHTDV